MLHDLATYFFNLLSFDEEHPFLFTQIHFWVFFLIVYVIYCFFCTSRTLTSHRRIARNGYLFAVSLFFYYKTQGWFVLLLVGSTVVGWLLGIAFDHERSQSLRKCLMWVGVVLNLLLLSFFKYAYFFTDIFNATFGTEFSIGMKIILPVGISFFTFQNISYIVDVYRRKIPHVSNIFDFGFYTSFFPQLVAGPILRADQFVPQLYRPFFLARRQFGIAVFWIVNGLVKKLLLSDYLAVNFVDRIFDNPSLYTPFENFAALMLYSLQVYADFSGYTDIAIGVAMLMGFYLPQNFNSPYKAQNPTDFWRRWHMSLSRWLRDYLYIPLGGNRDAGFLSYFILAIILAIAAFQVKSIVVTVAVIVVGLVIAFLYLFRPGRRQTLGTNINNMDTMLLGGLWHGASFNFITWGGLNGLGILIHKWWRRQGWLMQLFSLSIATVALYFVNYYIESPLLNILSFTSLVALCVYSILHFIPQTSGLTKRGWTIWGTLLTFVFISFTRLFFRSGSNLDPAEANEVAWQTATMMVQQIGGHWNFSIIPDIIGNYWRPFAVFAFGMFVHWLPTNFKRRYRLVFAQMPLWIMALTILIVVVFLYQFLTADLQPFIYFQF